MKDQSKELPHKSMNSPQKSSKVKIRIKFLLRKNQNFHKNQTNRLIMRKNKKNLLKKEKLFLIIK